MIDSAPLCQDVVNVAQHELEGKEYTAVEQECEL
jgi:hypothetical protein